MAISMYKLILKTHKNAHVQVVHFILLSPVWELFTFTLELFFAGDMSDIIFNYFIIMSAVSVYITYCVSS